MSAISPILRHPPKVISVALSKGNKVLEWVDAKAPLELEFNQEFQTIRKVFCKELTELTRIHETRDILKTTETRILAFFNLGCSLVTWLRKYRHKTRYQRKVRNQKIRYHQIRRLKHDLTESHY